MSPLRGWFHLNRWYRSAIRYGGCSLRNVSDFEQTTLLKIEVKIGWLKVGDFAQRVYHRVRSGALYKDEIAVKIIVESFK